MNNRPVAVIDSGVGGLPYLTWLQNNLPNEHLVYLADRKNFPYGTKSSVQVSDAALKMVSSVVEKEDPKLFVVACNTITVQAIDKLRRFLRVPVVGVVPAIKVAAQAYSRGTIGVLASEATANSTYLQDLIHKYCSERAVFRFAADDIISCIEEHYLDLEERQKILTQWAQRIRSQKIDILVLGCTHFLHISEDLHELLGDQVKIVDSCDGVGSQVRRVLQEKSLLNNTRGQVDRLFFTADLAWSPQQLEQMKATYQFFAQRFLLEYSGPWYL